jgi:thioredoxin-like negative regulator of GroEL
VDVLAAHFARKATFARLNVDDHPDLCAELEVRVIPLLLLFVPGREPERLVGAQSEAAIARMLYRALE